MLIIGGDSTLGLALGAFHRNLGHRVTVTTRRRPTPPDSTFLDLRDAERVDLRGRQIDLAFLCAAVTDQQACASNPELSREVNVLALSRISKRLADAGAFVVFFSSNAVFDGSVPMRRAGEPPTPVGEYGRQKADAEAAIAALGNAAAVVRLTKIFHRGYGLFSRWKQSLLRGQPIEAFDDLRCAPLTPGHILPHLAAIGAGRLPGVWQFSGARDVSYADIARGLAVRWNLEVDLVASVAAVSRAVAQEAVPHHTTLDSSRAVSTLAFEPPAIDDVLDEIA